MLVGRKSRAVLILVVMALLGTACKGSDDRGAQTGGGTVTSPSTTPASTAPPTSGPPTTGPAKDPALAAKAKAATLQPGDFPAGFAPQPDEPGSGLNLELLWTELTRCLGVDTAASRLAAATSPTFLRGLATQGRSTVEYTSEAATTAVTAAVAGPKFAGCANDAFAADVKRSAPEGGVPGPVTVAPRDLAVAPPAKASAFRINVTISLAELKVPLFQDFLIIVRGGTLIRMLFLNPGSEFPPDLEKTVVEKVVGRA